MGFIIDKEDLIDGLLDIEYDTKILFTVQGEEHEAELQLYKGDDGKEVIEICLNPTKMASIEPL